VNAEFVEMVEKNRIDEHIKQRKRKKDVSGDEVITERHERTFKQSRPLSATHGSASSKLRSDTLRSVFGSSNN
jgi:hypothetical protein